MTVINEYKIEKNHFKKFIFVTLKQFTRNPFQSRIDKSEFSFKNSEKLILYRELQKFNKKNAINLNN